MFKFLKEKIKNAVKSISKKIEKEKKVKEKKEIKKVEEKEIKPKEKKSLIKRIKERVTTTKISEDKFNELFWDLEVILLENNVASEVIDLFKDDLKEKLVDKPITRGKIEEMIKNSLKESIENLFRFEKFDLIENIKEKPYVICFVGINGSGKCVTGDTQIPLSDGRLMDIKDLYCEYSKNGNNLNLKNEKYVLNPNLEIFSFNPSTLKIEKKPIEVICKLKAPSYLYKITLKNGRVLTTTPEHPYFTISDGKILTKSSDNLQKGDSVAVPRILPVNPKLPNLLSNLKKEYFFVNIDNIDLFYKYLEKEYGNLDIAYKNLNIEQSCNTFRYFWRKRGILPIDLYLKFKNLGLKAINLQYGGSKPIPLIQTLTPELAEFVGLVLAECHLDRKVLELTNKDPMVIQRFKELSLILFGVNPNIFKDNRDLIRARIGNWSIINFVKYVFNIPFGNKSTVVKVPDVILQADDTCVKSFLRSYIEAEGHISLSKRTLEISTSSKDMAFGLSYLFNRVGILTSITKKKTSFADSYRVWLNGYLKFNTLSNISLYTKKNLSKLNFLNNEYPKQYETTELIPNVGSLIKKSRFNKNLLQKDISQLIETTPSMISMYESHIPIPRNNLKLISEHLKNRYLYQLSTSDISWIKIRKISKIKSKEKWVYDLTIKDNHNFVANGIVTHNTTTIAKVTSLLLKNNLKCVLAAADTFRAASIEQLEKHGDKLGVKVIKQGYGSDPAAVAFDAIEHAKAKHLDVVLIDTAGRMHSNVNLIEEMRKIIDVSKPDLKIFVGESITGNDCTEQARKFNDAINFDGIILSKQDVDEKGGAAISVSYVTGKPILFWGVGQEYGDLEVFDKNKIMKTLGL